MIELPDQRLFTVREVSELLGVSRKTVMRLYESGLLEGRRYSPRNTRFERGEVEEYIRRREEI